MLKFCTVSSNNWRSLQGLYHLEDAEMLVGQEYDKKLIGQEYDEKLEDQKCYKKYSWCTTTMQCALT